MGITFAYFVLHFDEFCPVSGAQPIYAHGIFRLTTTIEKDFPTLQHISQCLQR